MPLNDSIAPKRRRKTALRLDRAKNEESEKQTHPDICFLIHLQTVNMEGTFRLWHRRLKGSTMLAAAEEGVELQAAGSHAESYRHNIAASKWGRLNPPFTASWRQSCPLVLV